MPGSAGDALEWASALAVTAEALIAAGLESAAVDVYAAQASCLDVAQARDGGRL